MGTMFSLLAKSLGCSAISGYTAHRLLSSMSSQSSLPRSVHVGLTGFASYLGLAYYLKVWIQDYFFDWNYCSGDGSSSIDLNGRTAVVTGGTVGGLGFAAAELLYCQGATVVVTVRTREKGQAAVSKLKSNLKSKSAEAEAEAEDDIDHRASYVLCDFLSEASVRNCASELRSRFGEDGIDFLVLNAGVSSGSVPKSKSKSNSNSNAMPDTESSSDEDMAKIGAASVWMTNHVGPFVFANELMPLLIQKARQKNKTLEPSSECCPRVVWVSSGAHKRGAIDWDDPFHPRSWETQQYSVYAQSKLANILHAREYQRRVRDRLRREGESAGESGGADVKCFAVTPGAVMTNMFRAPLLLYPLAWFILRTPTKGAQVIKMACLDNDLEGGEYLSNCYVKETQGFESCSNDEAQWKRLWELTEEQVKAKEYEQWFGDSATAAASAPAANKKTD